MNIIRCIMHIHFRRRDFNNFGSMKNRNIFKSGDFGLSLSKYESPG